MCEKHAVLEVVSMTKDLEILHGALDKFCKFAKQLQRVRSQKTVSESMWNITYTEFKRPLGESSVFNTVFPSYFPFWKKDCIAQNQVISS